MQILSRYPLHSLFLSAYPIFYLYSQNAMYIDSAKILRSLALAMGISFFFLLGFRLILRDWMRAGLLTSLIIGLFFSFGHVAALLGPLMTDQGIPYKESFLGGAWILSFLIISFVVVSKGRSQSATSLLNFASAILLVVPLLYVIMIASGKANPSAREMQALTNLRGDADARPKTGAETFTKMPDIYFIVLDGYARADVLEKNYGYDNTDFIEALASRGFYIADQSRSNYLSTNYSLNSTLNLVYFQDLPKGINRNARYNLQTNFVSEFLREYGYKVVVFDSGTGNTNNQYYDRFVTPEVSSDNQAPALNPFEILLIKTTMGRLLIANNIDSGNSPATSKAFRASVNQELSRSRERIRHAFTHLPDYATQEENYFLFAHIYLPHVPFLYGQNEKELEYHGDPNVNWFLVHPDNYAENYGYQIDYLNRAVLNTIDRIQQSSKKPVVIILQADHGDDFLLDWNNPTADGVAARSSILNAIYFSDRTYEDLYRSMTPVNTFRMVFNHWFGTRYPLLQDKTLFHEHPVSETYGSRLEFQDACETYNICLPEMSNYGVNQSGSGAYRP